MGNSKRVAVVSGRILTGIAALGVAGLIALNLGRVELPSVTASAPGIEVNPNAADQSRVCAGPALALAGADSVPAAFAPAQSTVTADSEPVVSPIAGPTADHGSAQSFSISAEGARTPLLAAAQSQAVGLPELNGFAATACAEAGADSWLVAGSTAVGRTTIVMLDNPGRADVAVDLKVYGESGVVDAPGAAGIIVRAGEQKAIPLAGLAPGVEKPIIHVSTRGGQIFAAVQHSSIRGLTPSGLEIAGASAPPALQQYVPGVIIPEENAVLESDDLYDDRATALRLLIPGDTAANITISFVNEGAGETPMPIRAEVPAGEVYEIFLANLPPGNFGVSIESDAPVVSAARVTATDGSDFAWFAASEPMGDRARLAVAAGENPRLHLGNLGRSDALITLTAPEQEPITVNVSAGSGASVAVNPGIGYEVSGAGSVVGSVSYTGAGFSSYAVQPANPSASSVTVYPR